MAAERSHRLCVHCRSAQFRPCVYLHACGLRQELCERGSGGNCSRKLLHSCRASNEVTELIQSSRMCKEHCSSILGQATASRATFVHRLQIAAHGRQPTVPLHCPYALDWPPARASARASARALPPRLPLSKKRAMALTRALVGSSSSLRAALPVPPPLRALVSVRHLLSGSLERLGGPSWRHGARQAVMATAQQRPTAAAAVAAEAAAAAERRQQHHPPNATWEHPHAGIELVVGPMFAGKSTELLRRVAGYEAQGLSVAVVKSSRDDRYCSASVATHDGLKRVRSPPLPD